MVILMVGAKGRGKTKKVIDLLTTTYKHRELYAFDPQYEYRKLNNKARGKDFLTRDDFLKNTPHKKNSRVNVVYEEAAGFFSKNGSIPLALTFHICRDFHTKNLNVFNYHALTQFHTDNLIYVNYIILFRTQEDPIDVHKQFKSYPNIIKAFDDVRAKTENTFMDREEGTYPDERSKKFFHYHQIIQIN